MYCNFFLKGYVKVEFLHDYVNIFTDYWNIFLKMSIYAVHLPTFLLKRMEEIKI